MSTTVLDRAPATRVASAAAPPTTRRIASTRWHPRSWTAVLAVGLVVVTLAAATLTATGAAARSAADPDLARLLRAMAVIKSVLVALGAAGVGWRLQRPTPGAFAAGYLALVWIAGAAAGAMWQLAGVGQAAVALHAAGALLVVLAWRDAEFFPRPAQPTRPTSAP